MLLMIACDGNALHNQKQHSTRSFNLLADSTLQKLCDETVIQTQKKVKYDGSYYSIPYPNGDVPDSIGVCTDVIIRAYRKVGYDLQKLIHEDMKRNFNIYNKRRRSDKIDPNIDHRRTPNMETYFERFGKKHLISKNASDYKPGDIVFWDVAAGHVGLVVNHRSMEDTGRYMIVHNIGSGPKMQDFLFSAKITGHYSYTPWKK